MKLIKHIPHFPLSQYVEGILYLEGNNKGTGFPKTSMSLVFNLNDSFKLYTNDSFEDYIDYKKYWIAGLQTRPSYVESYGESKMMVVQFKTIGAFAFIQEPLHHFVESYVDLDLLFNNQAELAWEQLKEANTTKESFLIVENFLYRQLLSAKVPNAKLIKAVSKIFAEDHPSSIEELCKTFKISRKHLNFLFKEYAGVSPKMLSSVLRFQKVIKSISQDVPDRLGSVAYSHEYFDQAHFNRDFKRFTGLSPSSYLDAVRENPSLKIVPHFIPHSFN